MRNQQARVVLGAFLCVASAAAQAPANSSGSSTSGSHISIFDAGSSGETFRAGDFPRTVITRSRASRRAAMRDGLFDARSLQDDPGYDDPGYQGEDDPNYSLPSLFRQHHGEFLDRHERYDPSLELRVRAMPNQRVGDEPGTFDMIGYDFDIEVPVLITTEAYLLFGVYQYGRNYQTSSSFGSARNQPATPLRDGSFGDDTLTAAGARIGLGWFLDPNLLLEIETNPGVYSDLEGTLSHKDYDFPSSALLTYRPIDNFFLKAGLRYNQIFEDAPWLPYIGFSWEVVEGLRIDLLAPEYCEISYWPSAATSFAFGTFVQGAEYRVRSPSETGKSAANLNVQEVISYVGMTHRFTDRMSLQVRTGIVLAGDYNLTTGAPAFDNAEGALDQGFYADVTFGIDW